MSETNDTYEAVYRIACALYAEYENAGVEGYITYRELARILNRFGYEKQSGGAYSESHGKALGQMASAAWWYVRDHHGEGEADKIYRTIRDEHGCCHADQTDRRSHARD